ncbi:MAG TPA: TIGR01777 family oxidoreductase [Ignavibacteria bacterium]|nr:TIGR01777 family oxidoreductase [Ignavibacteria bacterium]
MQKTILITGATGMIGGHLIRETAKRGDRYIAVTTNLAAAEKKLKGAYRIVGVNDILSLKNEKIDAMINLAGSNLGAKRWTDAAKREFYDSRMNVTGSLIELIRHMETKPEVLISTSGVDYYGNTGSKEMYEDSPPANSFLGNLTHDWEQSALKAEELGVRTVIFRTGFVISAGSEAVKKLLMPVKLFVGGSLGSGKQYISWIHIDDLIAMYMFAIDNGNIRGIYNASAPNPQTNALFTRHAAKLLGRPAFMSVPSFVIKAVLGEMSTVVLDGRRAMPKKIIDAGFKFNYENDADAWKDILVKK